MKAAKRDESGVFNSILVHFGSDKARFNTNHLKINRSIMTVPTAWRFKPMTEVGLKLQLPLNKNGKARPIQCRGIIVDCRPLKQKGRYQVDLFLTNVPARHASLLQKLVSPIQSSESIS